MRESEFLDLIRYYFRNAKPSEVKEILADYEAHFEEGKKGGGNLQGARQSERYI